MTDRSSDESSLIEKNNKLWQPAEDTLSLFQLEMFHILRATLEYPADPEVKCAKLVDDIKFFFRSEDPPYLENVYEVILEVAGCLPSGHPWQDSLVGSVDSLRKGGGTILENGKWGLWKDLPGLCFDVLDAWFEPSYEEQVSGEKEQHKNLNSFLARLTSTGFDPWLRIPISQLYNALENPRKTGPLMEYQVWVASEWIIHCAKRIFQYMSSGEELEPYETRSLRTGPLCKEIPPLSVERWEFWRKQFSELAADADSLELDQAMTVQISNALKAMDAVTSRWTIYRSNE